MDVIVKVDGVSLGAGDDDADDAIEDLLPNINMVGMSYDLLVCYRNPCGHFPAVCWLRFDTIVGNRPAKENLLDLS